MKKKVTRSELDRRKYNYKYNTGIHINKYNKMHHNVYDFAWLEFLDGEILIIRKS